MIIDQSMRTDFAHWPRELQWTLEGGPDDAPFSIDIEVPYSIRFGSLPSWTDPGDPDEIETGTPWYVADGVLIELELTPAERERVELHIAENPPEPDYGDDYD